MSSANPPLLLVGCGILKKEVCFLIQKNGWPVDTFFLNSSLHVDFDKLSRALTSALGHHLERACVVFYGACHPCMDSLLESAKTFRTEGQNCVEMLLGPALFTRELEQGAFFLLEEWALCWEQRLTDTFGQNREVMREIFQGDRTHLLCINTPCSGDFREAADAAGQLVGLPIRWMDASLDHLEQVLAAVIIRKLGETSCQK